MVVPFYAEERQRDVWNEASALGVQVPTGRAMIRVRTVVFAVLYLIVGAGFLRAQSWSVWSGESGDVVSTLAGALSGSACVILMGLVWRSRRRRRERRADLPGDLRSH